MNCFAAISDEVMEKFITQQCELLFQKTEQRRNLFTKMSEIKCSERGGMCYINVASVEATFRKSAQALTHGSLESIYIYILLLDGKVEYYTLHFKS